MTDKQKEEYLMAISHFTDLNREITKTDRLIAISALRYVLASEIEKECKKD